MEIRCPYCDGAVTVPGGGQFTCPSCRAVFAVDIQTPPPAPATVPEPAPAAGATPPPRAPTEAESAPTISASSGPQEAPAPPPVPSVEPPPLPTFGSVPARPQALPGAPSGAPPCALHPDRPSVDTCRRCASFTCELCVQRHDGDVFCPRCIDRAGSITGIRGIPWETERDRLGLLAAYMATVKAVIFEPSRFFAGMTRDGGLAPAVVFYLISAFGFGSIVTGANIARLFANPEMMKIQAQALQRFGQAPPTMAQFAVMQLMMLPVSVVFLLTVWAGLQHLVALLLGARGSFETTVKILCYTHGALWPLLLVTIIPIAGLVGPLAYVVWYPVILFSGYQRAHGLPTVQALVCTLWPVAAGVGCCCCGATAALSLVRAGGQ